jgi:hypothetical protein
MGTRDAKGDRRHRPLAEDERFGRWTGPRSWHGGTVCFGSVVDDLIDGVAAHASRPHETSPRRWSMPAAIGCVPWMSHERMTAALARLGGCCIVLTKSANDLRAAQALHTTGRALPTAYLPGFDEVGQARPDGKRPIIGPHGLDGDSLHELGPVRRAGWRGDRTAPLIHAKLLVLGDAWGYDNDEEGPWGPQFSFRPQRAWLGSANWTRGATGHLEFGLWVDEPQLVEHTFAFLLDMLKFSEPFDTANDQPSPELVDAEWDDAAFAEYLADMGAADHDAGG